MSTLDLTSGYFQIALLEDDIPKTAFVTKQGAYDFRRLAFGLNGALASFQKAMYCILQPILGKHVFVYLDDINHRKRVLRRTHSHFTQSIHLAKRVTLLTVNLPKCKFARQELPFLSYTITQAGLKADNSKIKAVQDFLTP